MKLEKDKAFKERKHGVLMEDLDGKLDQVLEGYDALDTKIDRNHEEFREFVSGTSEKFELIFSELRELNRQRVA